MKSSDTTLAAIAAKSEKESAYHLRHASDIAGTYSSIGAGVAVAGGARVARLQNANGVVLELRGRQAGLQVSAGLSGLTLAMR